MKLLLSFKTVVTS